ncbi:MAG: hypothetical protein FD127_3825 [Acidimicrobiaceae bacterium]|nr:MAG: hypothetical protein FD127_3825 [Acidimicrobiaceae bacterium]
MTGNDGGYPRTKVLEAKGPRLLGDVFLGFTAATGGASATFEVDNLIVKQRCCEVTDIVSIAQQADVDLVTQDVVTLDGSGSSGADGGSFTYNWSVVSGNAALVAPGTGPTPQLKINGAGAVRVRLGVTDGACADGASAEMTFNVFCDDPAEVAVVAGAPAGTTAVNAAVVLDSAGSSAGTGDAKPFTRAWAIDSGPGVIDGASDGATVSVKGTAPGTVVVRLTIDDGKCGNAASATASFCVDDADTAVIVPPQGVQGVGTTVTVGSAAGSRSWSIVSGPGAIVGSASGNTVQVIGNAVGDLVVGLAVDDGVCNNSNSAQATISFGVTATWVRCDANGDKQLDISDPIFSLALQFSGGEAAGCPAALDCNGDGDVDISDPIFDLNFQFTGGPAPPAPYPACENFAGCTANCP